LGEDLGFSAISGAMFGLGSGRVITCTLHNPDLISQTSFLQELTYFIKLVNKY
jgi:hypothetical protein